MSYELTREQKRAVRQAWAKHVHPFSFVNRTALHVIYNVLRGKPADAGFVAKRSHLQSGYGYRSGPWAEYNNAVVEAARYLKRPKFFGQDVQDNPSHPLHRAYLNQVKLYGDADKLFLERFGIPRTDEFAESINEIANRIERGGA